MGKTIYSQEYALFLEGLRKAREEKGLTQTEVAERLGKTQSFVSKVERGERRIDIVELRAFCNALGLSTGEFLQKIETKMRDLNS